MKQINYESKKDITLLLTSSGGLTGVYLSKHFKETSNYRIIAIDMSQANPLSKWVDSFYKVPSVQDEMFLPTIKKIISIESVNIIIPITSYDVDYFSRTEIQNELKDVRILTMNYDDHAKLHNKESCYKYFGKIGISTPVIYSSEQEIEYPCVIKPRKGTGSKNTVIINNKSDYHYWSSKIVNGIIIQYLEGSEYTVDCLFNSKGKCLGANVRERIKTTGGGATITKNDYSININSIIERLEKLGVVKGPINFQFKVLPNDTLCVFDFNTRFASGGLPLTVQSGFDIPNLLVKILLGEDIKRWEINPENDGLTMIRYYEEYFVNVCE